MIIEARDDTITLRGTIKTNIWPAIQAAAALLLQHHPTGIIIDCSAVVEATTKGAETFADAFKYITSHNARIIVAALSPELVQISKVVPGVRSQLALAATVDEARASIALEEVTPQKGKARRIAVVPLLGNWQRAIQLSVNIAKGINADIHLVDLIKVPRTLPLGTPLPDRETAARARLDAAKASVEQTGVKSFTHAERIRSTPAGIIDFMDQLDASVAIINTDCGAKAEPFIEDQEAISLIETSNREIAIVKGSPIGEIKSGEIKVVLPAVGAWKRSLEFACGLVHGKDAVINVPYLIAIPRSEPIDVSKPDAESAAADAAREASRIGREYGVRVNPTVERVRDPILGFMKLFESHKYDLAVVGVRHETDSGYIAAREIAITLLQELPSEVMFFKTAS